MKQPEGPNWHKLQSDRLSWAGKTARDVLNNGNRSDRGSNPTLEQQQSLFAQQRPGWGLQKGLEGAFRCWKRSRRIAQQHFGIEILAELGQELMQPAADGFGGFHFKILGLLVAGEDGAGSFFAGFETDFGRVAEPEQALVLAGEIRLVGGL